MTEHVPSDLLIAFVEGEVGEHVAVHIAEHVDSCPSCATQAATLEPLASAFASMDDPAVPADLADVVIRELKKRERPPVVELAVGGVLLASAGTLAVVTQHPVTLLADLGAVLSASQALIRGMAAGLSPFTYAAVALTAFAALGGLTTMRMAQPRRA